MYPIGEAICRSMGCLIGYRAAQLAFVAVGALLGVKIFRRNAEHIVTLNANTMEHGLPRRRRFVFRGVGLWLSGFVCHGQILTYWRAWQHPCCVLRTIGILNEASRISFGAVGAIQAAIDKSFTA